MYLLTLKACYNTLQQFLALYDYTVVQYSTAVNTYSWI